METPSIESRLNNELLSMIGRYGVESLHKALINRMKEDYSYLKKYFENKKEEPLLKEKESKIFIEVLKNSEYKDIDNETVKNQVIVNEDSKNTNENDEKIVEVKQDSKKFRNPKEVKEWQKVQEEKKYEENKAKGVLKKDLLTKENLKKWIEEDGRTYSYIAREYIGCKDIEVSAAAKLWGISKPKK